MCYGQQAHTEEKEKFYELRKEQQGAKSSNQEKFQKSAINKKRRKKEKELQHFQEMKVKRASPTWQKAWKVEKFHPLVLNEI